MHKNYFKLLFFTFLLSSQFFLSVFAINVRIKDITKVQGLREHYLVGYGLVSGLPSNSGDKNSMATNLAQINMLKNFGINLKEFLINNQINVINLNSQNIGQRVLSALRQLNGGSVGNVAAVMVTAKVPSYTKEGDHFDVSVSSFGSSRNLTGGVLLQTMLKGPDGKVYALAQGPVINSGYEIEANGSLVRDGSPNSGRIPKGGIIEIPLPTDVMANADGITLTTEDIDFSTTRKIVDTINNSAVNRRATIIDGRTIKLELNGPEDNPVVALADVGELFVDAENKAKVVIMERTGTIVVGADVKLSSVAIAHGNISITINTKNAVSQPALNLANVNVATDNANINTNPYENTQTGDTEQTPLANNYNPGINTQAFTNSDIEFSETDTRYVALEEATTLSDLVNELNKIGVTSRDLIAIMQALKASGSLQADLEII